MVRPVSRTVGLMALCALTACASANQLYPGAKRPPEQVATLKMVTNGAITNINGRELEGRHYALLPGDYGITFRYIVQADEIHPSWPTRETYTCLTRLQLEAGGEYEIERMKFRTQFDRQSRRQIAGVNRVDFVADLELRRLDHDGKVASVDTIVCEE